LIEAQNTLLNEHGEINMVRKSKIQATFDMMRAYSGRVACSRRHCVAILMRDDAIISTGYNGSCRGSRNCGEDVPCLKDIHKEAPLASYVHCPAIHAEVNAVINAARTGTSTFGATLYFYSSVETDSGEPCIFCRRVLINAGIKDAYIMNGKDEIIHRLVSEWVDAENDWMKKEQLPEVNSECQNGPDIPETVNAEHKA
jgi:dCMP deaminase